MRSRTLIIGLPASFFLILAIASAPTPLFAQGLGATTGTLAGDTSNESGASLPGVLISVSSGAGVKTATTDASGKFLFPYLTPGAYQVKAELSGFTTIEQEDVRIRLGSRTEISFKIKMGTRETINISGTPLVDTQSTTTGVNITETLLHAVPVARTFAELTYLAPGVIDSFVGGGNVSISGASGLENTYIIDGVNITEPGIGSVGTFSPLHFGVRANAFSTEMIQEVEVKSGGFQPEYGESLGGIINVITKSGGNSLKGSIYSYFTPASFVSDGKSLNFETTYEINAPKPQTIDAGVEIGGPVKKDKIFFFGAYNPSRLRLTFLNDPSAPSFQEFPEAVNIHISHSYSAKVTAKLTNNHTLEFSAFGDPTVSGLSNQDGNDLTSTTPQSRVSELRYGNNSFVGRWNGVLGSDMFVEAQVARADSEFNEIPAPQDNLNRINDKSTPYALESGNPTVSGGYGGYERDSGTSLQYSAKFTNHYKGHEIRYGAQFQDIHYDYFFARTGNTVTAFNGQQSSSGYTLTIWPDENQDGKYEVVAELSPSLMPSRTKYFNWFAQDSWNPAPFLNLDFGMRWERQRIKGNNAGATDVTFDNNWAPRIGATYDYLRNGRSKAYFHYGRFYEKIPNLIAAIAFTPFQILDAFYSDPAFTHFTGVDHSEINVPQGVEGLGGNSSPFHTKAEYANEWVAGMEQEISAGFAIGAHFIYRNINRVIENIEVNLDAPCAKTKYGCVPPGLTVEDLQSGATSGALITNVDGHYPGYPALIRDYKAIEFTAERRLSNNWQFLASYRFAKLAGNYEGNFAEGSQSPNFTSVADFAQSPALGYYYGHGPLPNDIQNVIKFFSSYQWKGLTSGIGFKWQTGRPINNFGATPAAVRLLTPRGSVGRTDSNTTLDLHEDYNIHFGENNRLALGVDIFNVFNSQSAITVDQQSEFYIDGSSFSNPNFLRPTAFQEPRSIRLFLRYSF